MVWGGAPHSVFGMWLCSCPSTVCRKDSSFPHWMVFTLLSKISRPQMWGFISRLSIPSIVQYVYPYACPLFLINIRLQKGNFKLYTVRLSLTKIGIKASWKGTKQTQVQLPLKILREVQCWRWSTNFNWFSTASFYLVSVFEDQLKELTFI